MAAPCQPHDERARKNLASILRGLASVGQAKVADELKVAESTVSRMKEGELDKLARMLAICGLKVVPETYECVEPDIMHALLILAGQRVDSLRRKPSLIFSEEADA